MKRTSIVGTRRMATPARKEGSPRHRIAATVLMVVVVLLTAYVALKTAGSEMQLHDPLAALVLVVLSVLCGAFGVSAAREMWRPGP